VARGIAERPEAAHREASDRPPVVGAVGALEELAQLDEVEGLPSRAAPPIGVEAGASAIGHRDDDVVVRGELLDVGGARPGDVGVTAAVQEVDDGPATRRVAGEAGGQQQAHRHGPAHRGRAHAEVELARRPPPHRDDPGALVGARRGERRAGVRRGRPAATTAAAGHQRRDQRREEAAERGALSRARAAP
jgi:hypothetical protein